MIFHLAKLADRPLRSYRKAFGMYPRGRTRNASTIAADGNDSGLRFLRKATCWSTGFFLGYNMNILNHIRKNNQGHVGLQSLIFMGK